MSRNSIALIWVVGLVLAAIVYVAGPDRFLWAVFDFMQSAWWNLQDALRNLSLAAFDLVRALAIGLYFVAMALGLMVIRRGGRARAALIALTVVFFALIWRSAGMGFGAHTRWLLALLLAAASALSMTRRLTRPTLTPWQSDPVPPGQGP